MGAAALKKKSRIISNPPRRLELRSDFPCIARYDQASSILPVIRTELEKCGKKTSDVGRINIAYPHKNPEKFKDHFNGAAICAVDAQDLLSQWLPEIEWVKADALCETVHLDRSGDQSSAHALTRKQLYDLYMPVQEQPFPFADPLHTGTEYFIVVDSCTEQGTTLVNLMNFITCNGGPCSGGGIF